MTDIVPLQRRATGPHTRDDSPIAEQSRLERRIRRSFGRLVGAAPEAAETLITLMSDPSMPGMVRYLSAKTILSSVGLGEISKQVQKSTQEIRMQGTTSSVEQTVARMNSPKLEQLLIDLERELQSRSEYEDVIDGEVKELGPGSPEASRTDQESTN